MGLTLKTLRYAAIPALLIVLSLLVPTATLADDPAPPSPPPAIMFVGPGEGADGSPEKPFLYEQGDKGKLGISIPDELKAKAKIKWKLDQAPADTEPIGLDLLWFPTNVPNRYLVMSGVQWDGDFVVLSAWLEIKGSGPSPPSPNPDSALTARVLKGFTGQDKAILSADAKKFKSATVALLPQIPNLKTVLELQDALDATLQAVQWPKGRYGDLSNLAGELAGDGGKDRPLDAARATSILTIVGKACDAVVAANSGVKK